MLALSALLQSAGAGAAAPAPNDRLYSFDGIPNVSFVYYDVYGATPREIRRYMDEHGALGRSTDGHAYSASTRPDVSWRAIKQSDADGCRITRVDMVFRVEVTLPRLANRAAVPSTTLRRWDDFVARLTAHEAGHAHYAYDPLDEIRAAILQAGCSHGNEAGTALLERDEQRDRDYEIATDHGRLQGVSFP